MEMVGPPEKYPIRRRDRGIRAIQYQCPTGVAPSVFRLFCHLGSGTRRSLWLLPRCTLKRLHIIICTCRPREPEARSTLPPFSPWTLFCLFSSPPLPCSGLSTVLRCRGPVHVQSNSFVPSAVADSRKRYTWSPSQSPLLTSAHSPN